MLSPLTINYDEFDENGILEKAVEYFCGLSGPLYAFTAEKVLDAYKDYLLIKAYSIENVLLKHFADSLLSEDRLRFFQMLCRNNLSVDLAYSWHHHVILTDMPMEPQPPHTKYISMGPDFTIENVENDVMVALIDNLHLASESQLASLLALKGKWIGTCDIHRPLKKSFLQHCHVSIVQDERSFGELYEYYYGVCKNQLVSRIHSRIKMWERGKDSLYARISLDTLQMACRDMANLQTIYTAGLEDAESVKHLAALIEQEASKLFE